MCIFKSLQNNILQAFYFFIFIVLVSDFNNFICHVTLIISKFQTFYLFRFTISNYFQSKSRENKTYQNA